MPRWRHPVLGVVILAVAGSALLAPRERTLERLATLPDEATEPLPRFAGDDRTAAGHAISFRDAAAGTLFIAVTEPAGKSRAFAVGPAVGLAWTRVSAARGNRVAALVRRDPRDAAALARFFCVHSEDGGETWHAGHEFEAAANAKPLALLLGDHDAKAMFRIPDDVTRRIEPGALLAVLQRLGGAEPRTERIPAGLYSYTAADGCVSFTLAAAAPLSVPVTSRAP